MVTVLISALLGGLLLLAGVPHLRDREGRLVVVRGYRLLPEAGERLVAGVLPYVEILLGVLLVAGLGAPLAPAAAGVLFLIFFAALAINLLRGRRELDCGCFAFAKAEGSAPRIGWFHAGRALVLAALAVVLAVTPGGYGIGVTPVAEHLLGSVLAALVLAIGLAVLAVRRVIHPHGHAVDTHLSRARAQLRVASRARP